MMLTISLALLGMRESKSMSMKIKKSISINRISKAKNIMNLKLFKEITKGRMKPNNKNTKNKTIKQRIINRIKV
jgi:hypothetical protein